MEAEGTLISELIAQAGYERKEFALLAGITDDILGNICRGITKLKGPRLSLFAKLFKMSEDELRRQLVAAGKPRPPSSSDARPDRGPLDTVNVRGKIIVIPQGMVPVPVFSSVPASMPSRTFSQASDVEFVPDYDSDLPMWGAYVSGDSMDGGREFDDEERFYNGDVVLFEERQPLPYQAVFAEKDGEETFKILVPSEGEAFELWPLNEIYEPLSALDWTIRGVIRRRVRYGRSGSRNIQEFSPSHTFRIPKQ